MTLHTCILTGTTADMRPLPPCPGCQKENGHNVIRTETDAEVLARLRNAGWLVVCHNDYRLKGDLYTFWSFARDGRYVKGEGRSDREALEECEEAVKLL